MMKPVTETHNDITVIREDKVAGGTKSRFLHLAFKNTDEVVYGSSHCGGGQAALALTGHKLKKQVTIFTAARNQLHARQKQAMALGAKYRFITPGYQSVIECRVKEYCQQNPSAKQAPFGLQIEGYDQVVAQAAEDTKLKPHTVWVSAGSGGIAKALRLAWKGAEFHLVEVGAKLDPIEFNWATIHTYERPYKWCAPSNWAKFPSDGHYELKCWDELLRWRDKNRKGTAVFWNTMGDV
jgi:hypothetical protein